MAEREFFKCACGKAVRWQRELAGTAVVCPGCGARLRMPPAPAAQPAPREGQGTQEAGASAKPMTVVSVSRPPESSRILVLLVGALIIVAIGGMVSLFYSAARGWMLGRAERVVAEAPRVAPVPQPVQAEAPPVQAPGQVAAGKPAEAKTKPAKEKASAAKPQTRRVGTKLVGGHEGEFEDLAPEGGLLCGFRLWYGRCGRGKVLWGIEPTYQVGAKRVKGPIRGKTKGKADSVMAKPGHVVGAVTAKGGHMVDGLRVHFVPVGDDGKLKSGMGYDSGWHGGTLGGGKVTLDKEGHRVVGIHGRTLPQAGAWAFSGTLAALGLVLEE